MDGSSRGGVGQVDGFSLPTVRAPEVRWFCLSCGSLY